MTEENVQMLETDKDKLKFQHSAQISQLNSKLEALKTENLGLVERLEEEKNNDETSTEQLRHEISDLNSKLEELKTENTKITHHNKVLQEEIKTSLERREENDNDVKKEVIFHDFNRVIEF